MCCDTEESKSKEALRTSWLLFVIRITHALHSSILEYNFLLPLTSSLYPKWVI